MTWMPDDPKEGLAAHAAGKTGPQAAQDAEWDLLGAVTLEMPVTGRSNRVGVIQRQFAIDGAGNLQVLKLVFVGNNNNKTRLQQFTYSPTGALLHHNVIRFGHTDDLNSGDFWKGDGFAASGNLELEVYGDCHQIPGPGGFNRAGMGGNPDEAPLISPSRQSPLRRPSSTCPKIARSTGPLNRPSRWALSPATRTRRAGGYSGQGNPSTARSVSP
jgi:hypothetical protein